MRKLYFLFPKLYYSFPIQLVLNNLKRNQVLVLCWVLLFAMINGNIGRYLGIPFLFLDPEYLNQVSFISFFIIGVTLAGLTTAFHITCYISDGHRFSFIGALPRPFTRFAFNNSLLPFLFLVYYVYEIVEFQIISQYNAGTVLAWNLAGFLSGFVLMILLFFAYFWFTNKDIFRYVVCQIDEKLKQQVKVTRVSVMKKLDIARKKQVRVDYYADFDFKLKQVEDSSFYNKASILQVFDQNHFNSVVIEIFIFILILILGIFKDYPIFQLPAAASFIIFLTVFVMLAGAFSYWFGGWSASVVFVLFLVFNYMVGEDVFRKRYEAFGLSYSRLPAEYSIEKLRALNDTSLIKEDRSATLLMLENWRAKFPVDEKPRMIFLCVSGGGKRAALWAFNAMQQADSLTQGRLMHNTVLITGASGGLIGASYFRELKWREQKGENIYPYSASHRQQISSDNLNPLIFSLLANDLFVGFTEFEYAGHFYKRDRGYTFEEQLNQITEGLMDKPIMDYHAPEMSGEIPMMIFSPTIVNDGRKMYIATRPVSFMNSEVLNYGDYSSVKHSGIDFMRLFKKQGSENLRFLSALRMSATFPYITPNTTLPTEPPIQIMDAGISDNFGVSDAARFLYTFRDWIDENTSGVVILSIRDSPKMAPVVETEGLTFLNNITQPISSVYNNFENFQDINSDLVVGQAKSWMEVPIDRVDIEYFSESIGQVDHAVDSLRQSSVRASLSWRLTEREKQGIIQNIKSVRNQQALNKLESLLQTEREGEVPIK